MIPEPYHITAFLLCLAMAGLVVMSFVPDSSDRKRPWQ